MRESTWVAADMKLKACIPRDKFDLEAVRRARSVGFPALNPVLPDLLAWLQDMNWPVAPSMVELLSTSGSEIVPHVRAALASGDAIWTYWLLTRLCPGLSPALLVELRPDIERLASGPPAADPEGVGAAAEALLAHVRREREGEVDHGRV